MPHRVSFSPAAVADITAIYDWIVGETADDPLATGYVEAIKARCLALTDFPRRGRLRSGGAHSIVVNRRAVVTYRVGRATVTILRVYHRGRDIPA